MSEPQRRRVVVTGMGAITPAGAGVGALQIALAGGRHCFRPVTAFSTEGLRVHIAGQVNEIPPVILEGSFSAHRTSRSDRLALFAVEQALARCGLAAADLPSDRVGVAIGTSTGGMLETEAFHAARLDGLPPGRLRPQLLSATVGSPTDVVAAAVGALGPRLSPSTACSSSAIAIAIGMAWIRSGRADLVIAGGTDALCRMTYTGFHALQALAPEPCRPFDRDRRGLTLGEGAAALILEADEHARARRAPLRGEILGAGLSCDAAHPTAPHGEGTGARQALAAAFADANVSPSDVAYVNAHGTGTLQNDACEARILRDVFTTGATPPVSSTKGLTGHLLGAAGAVEAVATLLALADASAPPTLGLEHPDPDCAVDLIRHGPRGLVGSIAVSNSYGFGGNNCSLILARP